MKHTGCYQAGVRVCVTLRKTKRWSFLAETWVGQPFMCSGGYCSFNPQMEVSKVRLCCLLFIGLFVHLPGEDIYLGYSGCKGQAMPMMMACCFSWMVSLIAFSMVWLPWSDQRSQTGTKPLSPLSPSPSPGSHLGSISTFCLPQECP